MRRRNPVEGATSQVLKGNSEESNLEIKRRAMRERRNNPEIVDLPDDYKNRSKFSSKERDDEKETGLLEDDEEELKEDVVPTGLLDDDDDEEEELPELEQRVIDEPEEEPQKPQDVRRQRGRQNGLEARENRERRNLAAAREERRGSTSHEGNSDRKPRENQEGRQSKKKQKEETPPRRMEDKIADERRRSGRGNANKPSGGSGKGGGSGAGIVVVLIIVILIVLFVVGFLVIRAVRPDLINSLFNGNIGGVQTERLVGRETEDFSNSIYYSNVKNAILELYTDTDKHDIREDVSSDDVRGCLDLLATYQTSDEYNETAYNELSGELQTISLFLQDRETYNSLMSGEVTFTEEEMNSKIQGIRNDILMYRVQSLASAMNAKLGILETMSSVPTTPSTDFSDFGDETPQTNATVETEAPQNQNVMQTWGSGSGLIVEGETE